MSKKRIDSPCIKVCSLDERTGYCLGCLRTLEEIVSWSQMDNRERKIVYQMINERKISVRSVFENSVLSTDQ